MEPANNQNSKRINPSAAIFNKEQIDKILQELDLKVEAKNNKKSSSVPQNPQQATITDPAKSVGDILKENFLEE